MGFQRRGNFKTFQMQIGLDRLRGKEEQTKGLKVRERSLILDVLGFTSQWPVLLEWSRKKFKFWYQCLRMMESGETVLDSLTQENYLKCRV